MEIQVIKKSKQVTLLFKKSNIRYQGRKTPIVSIYDDKEDFLTTSVKLTHIQKRVPSTLLARWINSNLAEKLLTLKDRCNTVEKVKDGVVGKWYFTNKPDSIYGLHKTKIKENGVTYRVVKIDDSIGMQSTINILNELGVDIEPNYDKVTNKMISINLKGV